MNDLRLAASTVYLGLLTERGGGCLDFVDLVFESLYVFHQEPKSCSSRFKLKAVTRVCLVIYAQRQQLVQQFYLNLVDLVHRGDLFHQEPKSAIESLLHAQTLAAYCMQVNLISSRRPQDHRLFIIPFKTESYSYIVK